MSKAYRSSGRFAGVRRDQGRSVELRRSGDLLGRFLEVTGAAVLVLTLVLSWSNASFDGAAFLGQTYLVGNVTLFVAVIVDSRKGGLSLLVRFFFLFFVALPALVQIVSDVYPWGAWYQFTELATGYRILAVAQLAMIGGEILFRGRGSGGVRETAFTPMRPDFFRTAMLVLTLVVMPFIVYLGPTLLLSTRFEIGSSNAIERLDLQLLQICRSIILLAVIICFYLWKNDRDSRRDSLFILASALTVAVFFVFFYPPALSRFMLMGAVVALSSIWLKFYFTRTVKILFSMVSPVFLLLLFPAIKVLGSGRVPDLAAAVQRDVQDYLLRTDFDAFKQVVDTSIYIQETGNWRFGENFLGVLLFWVPRSIWPQKPITSGHLIAESLGYSYTNVSNPLPSEVYLSFGMLGVVVSFVFIGWWMTRLESQTRLTLLASGLGREVLLYAMVMGFAIIIFRGAIQGVVSAFGAAFLAYWILAWLHDRSPRVHRRAGAESESVVRSGSSVP